MNRQVLINNTISKIRQLSDTKIKEVNDFADFLLSKMDDQIIREGIKEMISDSKSYDFLKEEENLYTFNDLKERYK